ncbi:hypothetical protein Tco_0152475 [Tanacetum coccineum]
MGGARGRAYAIEGGICFHFSILYRDTVCCDDIHSCLRLAFRPGGLTDYGIRAEVCLLLSIENIMLQWLLQLGVGGLTKSDGVTVRFEFPLYCAMKVDDTITRVPGTFQGYETSEEESVERPRERDLYEFRGRADELKGNEVDADLDSYSKSKHGDKRKGVDEPSKTGGFWKDNKKAKTRTGFVATTPARNEAGNSNPKCNKCFTVKPHISVRTNYSTWRSLIYQEPPYALPEALLAPVTHNDPRDPYVAARDAATAPATDNDDSPTQKETSPSEPQGSPPRDS